MKRKLITILLFVFLSIISAQSDKILNMSEIIVTAGRIPLMLNELSRSVEVLDSAAIHELPVNSIQDILQYAGGVDLRSRGSNGVQADASIHGGTSDETLIMIDGVAISDPQTGHHNLNIPLSTDAIDRIEVLKGQGSAVFGPNAFSGAINIITKKSHESSLSVSSLGGENGLWDIDAYGNYSIGPFANNISFSKKKSDGYRFNTAFDITNFSYSQNIQAGTNNINILLGYIDKQFGANSFYSNLFPNQWEHTTTGLLNASANFAFNSLSIIPKIYWRRNNDNFYLDHDSSNWNHSINETNSYGAELQVTLNSSLGTTSIGGELSGNEISGGLGNHSRNNNGLFAEHLFSPLKDLNISLGGFAYNYSGAGLKLWPDAEANYKMNDAFRVFGSVGKAFRVPTYTDLYSTSAANKGNADLNSEEVINYEIGLAYDKEFFQSSISLFIKDGSNLIDWIRKSTKDPWLAENVMNIRTTGIEASIYLFPKRITNKFPINNVFINYTYLEANRDPGTYQSKYLLDQLRHQFIMGITNEVALGILQNWNFRYEERVNYQPQFILDMKFSKKIDRFELTLGATNLLNRTIIDISGVTLPGRWISGGIKYSINNL
jgi:iron complex outermembrane receptor protein